jgi:hypothetical protein
MPADPGQIDGKNFMLPLIAAGIFVVFFGVFSATARRATSF